VETALETELPPVNARDRRGKPSSSLHIQRHRIGEQRGTDVEQIAIGVWKGLGLSCDRSLQSLLEKLATRQSRSRGRHSDPYRASYPRSRSAQCPRPFQFWC